MYVYVVIFMEERVGFAVVAVYTVAIWIFVLLMHRLTVVWPSRR